MMLASKYADQNPTGYWVSEKYDGVRALWTGEILVSRNGYRIDVPSSFLAGLPTGVRMDGELWLGRGNFQKLVRMLQQPDCSRSELWDQVHYMVFDTPDREQVFEDRQRCLQEYFPCSGPATLVKHFKCRDEAEMRDYFNEVTDNDGEGIVLRVPESMYINGRSDKMLKLKKIKSDEAVVKGYAKGRGKNKMRLGTLLCDWLGMTIKVGSGIPDTVRNCPPPIGSLVTFNYLDTTDSGQPREARFGAVRNYE